MIWTPPKTWVKADNINVPDWQRIDDNTRWIAEFYGVTLPYKTWAHTDFPTPMEMARIQSNIEALIKYFQGVYTGSRIEISQKFSGELQNLLLAGRTTQDGTGDPSPDNVRAIRGTTALTVSDGGNQSQTIALPQPLYSLPDGVADSYDAVSGQGTANILAKTYNGTEAWYKAAIDTTNLAGFGITERQSGNKNILCDRLNVATVAMGSAREQIYVNTASQVFVRVLKSRLAGWSDSWTDAQKVAAFKVWLQSDPVTVLYELATPQTITGTAQTIPTYYPYTQIVNDAGAEITAVMKGDNHNFQSKFDWNLLNDIESLLLEMHAKVVELQLSVRRSGTFVSGHETYIPLGGT